MIRAGFIIALLFAATTVNAGVYKCTAPDGSLTFSDKPCPGQTNEQVEVRTTEPTDRQREEAAQVLERDQATAQGKRETSPAAQDSKPTRPTLYRGMTKEEVRAAWGSPDYVSPYKPTNWGYHDEPPANVTFDANDQVMSVFVDR